MKPTKKPKTVELVKSDYQPTKAEKEEEFSLDVPGETAMERLENLTRAVQKPAKIRWIDKPRRRRG